jgi:hypothetical protein
MSAADAERRPSAPNAGNRLDAGDAVSAPKARQGVTHHNVRVVLAVSLGLTVLALVFAYFAFFGG